MKRKISLMLLLMFVCGILMGFTPAPAPQPLTAEQQKNIILGLSDTMIDNLNSILKDYKAYGNAEITSFSLINTSTLVEVKNENLKMLCDYIDPKITVQEYRLLLVGIKNTVDGTRRLVKLCEDTYINEKTYPEELTTTVKSFYLDYQKVSNFMKLEIDKQLKELELKKNNKN